MNYLKTFLSDEDGTSATEYAIMISLIVMVIVSTVGTLGSKANSSFNNAASQL
jgi:Flp pilus assembly pilin Flp